MKLEPFRRVFEKLYRNPFSRSRVLLCEQTDRRHVAILRTRYITSDQFYFLIVTLLPCVYKKQKWTQNTLDSKYQSCYSGVFMYFFLLPVAHNGTEYTVYPNEYRFRFESMRRLWISWTEAGKAVANRRHVLHQCVLLHSGLALYVTELATDRQHYTG